jgi:hypothetical protein
VYQKPLDIETGFCRLLFSNLTTNQAYSHRLLFIGLLVAALIAKMIVPDQIQLSFLPIAITILAEATYILIDLTCALLSKIGRHFQNIWAVVKEWFRFRLVIGGAMG